MSLKQKALEKKEWAEKQIVLEKDKIKVSNRKFREATALKDSQEVTLVSAKEALTKAEKLTAELEKIYDVKRDLHSKAAIDFADKKADHEEKKVDVTLEAQKLAKLQIDLDKAEDLLENAQADFKEAS